MSEAKQKGSSWTMLLDYGPLLVFFVTYKLAGSGLQGSLVATFAFMVAVIISIAVGLAVVKRVSPMVWVSTVLILGFGAITLYLRDPKFIQMKPTVIYVGFAALLGVGLLRGKPLLKWLFGPVFPGLTQEGWLKLSRNWALFFLALAVANEVMRATLTFDTWLTLKVWGVTIVSIVFAIANMPMLLRHGLDPEKKTEAIADTPGRMSDPILSIRGLRKQYATGVEALKAVDLDIRRGEIFALLGPERRRQDDDDQHHLRHRERDRRRSADRRQELAEALPRSAHAHRPCSAGADAGRVRAADQHG